MGGAQGQASDMEITLQRFLKLKKELYAIISHHSGQPFDKVEADSDRDHWMTSEEAKIMEWLTKFFRKESGKVNE